MQSVSCPSDANRPRRKFGARAEEIIRTVRSEGDIFIPREIRV